MTTDVIGQKVIDILIEKGIPIVDMKFDLDTPINLFLNSIGYVQLVVAVEEEFGFEMSDENLDKNKFNSLRDFVGSLEENLKRAGG